MLVFSRIYPSRPVTKRNERWYARFFKLHHSLAKEPKVKAIGLTNQAISVADLFSAHNFDFSAVQGFLKRNHNIDLVLRASDSKCHGYKRYKTIVETAQDSSGSDFILADVAHGWYVVSEHQSVIFVSFPDGETRHDSLAPY